MQTCTYIHLLEKEAAPPSETKSLTPQAWAQSMIEWMPFQSCTAMFVAMHVAWMIVELRYTKCWLLKEMPLLVGVLDNAFLWYFCLELMIRFLACQDKQQVFRDVWFLMDSALIIAMIVGEFTVPPKEDVASSAGPISHVLKHFRIFARCNVVLVRGIRIWRYMFKGYKHIYETASAQLRQYGAKQVRREIAEKEQEELTSSFLSSA
jgi:hypothetical protein